MGENDKGVPKGEEERQSTRDLASRFLVRGLQAEEGWYM